jgi:hypothetical protein
MSAHQSEKPSRGLFLLGQTPAMRFENVAAGDDPDHFGRALADELTDE